MGSWGFQMNRWSGRSLERSRDLGSVPPRRSASSILWMCMCLILKCHEFRSKHCDPPGFTSRSVLVVVPRLGIDFTNVHVITPRVNKARVNSVIIVLFIVFFVGLHFLPPLSRMCFINNDKQMVFTCFVLFGFYPCEGSLFRPV